MAHSKTTERSNFLIIYLIVVAIIMSLIVFSPLSKVAPQFKLTQSELYGILVGMLTFVAFWRISSHFLFTPLLNLLEAREAATSGSFEQSKGLLEKAKNLENEVEAKLFKVRSEVAKEREHTLQKTKEICNDVLKVASDKAEHYLTEKRSEIQQEVLQMKNKLATQHEELAQEASQKIRHSLGVN